MTFTAVQKAAVEEVINVLYTTTPPRSKRQLAGMFLDLVDRTDWPQYYELIPEPRCLNNIRSSVEKNRYKDALDAFTDLSLVFWNAMFYNESASQIAHDAETLKGILETEWKKRTVLPIPRSSPPPSAPQKVHSVALEPAPVPPVAPAATTPVPARALTHTPSAQLANASKATPSDARSPARQESLDVDVDGNSMSPDPDGTGEDIATMERDVGSEEIVRQLEKSLPKWQGFGELGWMADVDPERHLEIVHAIKNHKDIIGNRMAVALEAVPEESSIPNLSYSHRLSLKTIEGLAKSKNFSSSQEFDKEMTRLFEKARRWHEPSTDAYGRVLLLQRLYQALTSSTPPPGPPYLSTANFASLRAGPGNTKPLHPADGETMMGVTSFRISTKDRTFVDEVHYKGWSVKLADWLHLSNADDPSRPIVAQVFRCWTSDDPLKNGQPGLTVCWYHRPEQTFHLAHRQFWEGEVFKTGHFADHALEDVIEKIACQFTARHIRGRPRPPFWYPGWPLYVCDSRYNDRERVFVKIKNWNSCVPEEVRKSTEFMPIYPFERTVFPKRVGSPFLTKSGKGSVPVKGPGGIEEGVEAADGEKVDGVSGSARKRPKRVGAATAMTTTTTTTAANTGSTTVGDHAVPSAKGTTTYVGTPGASTSTYAPYQASHTPQNLQTPHRVHGNSSIRDRSVIGTFGSLANIGNNAVIEKLPPETAKHFDRDPDTNEVLWFSSPPMNMVQGVKPKHSLTYLHFLAMKRKREEGLEGEGEDKMNVDGEVMETGAKRGGRAVVRPNMTEAVNSILENWASSEG